jgi:hypothetical protein
MSERLASKALNWIARIWSLAGIAFVLVFVFGEVFGGHGVRPTAAEWIGLALWLGGVGIGLAVAWCRKGLGGAIALGSLVGFYFWNLLERGRFRRGPYFLLVAAPGVLFLLLSILSRPTKSFSEAT